MLSAEPIDTTEAMEAMDPTLRNDPAEPMLRMDPAEPMLRIDPDEPMLRIDPVEPMLRIDPERPAETTREDDSAAVRMGHFYGWAEPAAGRDRRNVPRLPWDHGRRP